MTAPFVPSPAAEAYYATEFRHRYQHASKGYQCNVCDRYKPVFRRQHIDHIMARHLIRAYRRFGLTSAHWPTEFGRESAEDAKMRFWELIEKPVQPAHKGKRKGSTSGYWQVTHLGELFVQRQINVRYSTLILTGNRQQSFGFEGPYVSIKDCLGTYFDYATLMTESY